MERPARAASRRGLRRPAPISKGRCAPVLTLGLLRDALALPGQRWSMEASATILDGWGQLESAILEPVTSTAAPPFGAPMRREHFPGLGQSHLLGLQPTAHYLNQGGTGMVMGMILQLQQLAGRLAEEQPMSYHREIAPALMRRARQSAAEYLGTAPEALSFMASASAGFYAVMRAISLSPGDIVLTTSLRYHSFGDDLADHCAELGVEVRTVPLPLPISSTDEILSAFRAVFDTATADGSLARFKLAFFDHVSSKPAVLFPVAELCALCRERGVPSLVDGAHCPGLLCWAGECDPPPAGGARLDQILPDYYLANFYKWMMTPRQCACLYTNPAASARWEHIHTASLNVTLPGMESAPSMESEAIYAGNYDESTRDYAPFLALPGALALLRWMGPARLRAHGGGLAGWGSAHLAKVWETGPRPVAAELSTSMITAELPLTLPLIRATMRARRSDGGDGEAAAALSWAKTQAHRELLTSHRIECPVFVHEGRLYVRASCALYNDRDDIEALGEAVLAIAVAWASESEAEQAGSLSKL